MRYLLLVSLLLISTSLPAQEEVITSRVVKTDEPVVPNPAELRPHWWDFYRVEGELLDQRIKLTLSNLDTILEQIPEDQKEIATTQIQRIKLNLIALPAVMKLELVEPDPVRPIKEHYSLDDLISLTQERTKAEAQLLDEKQNLAIGEEQANVTEKQLDNLFVAYQQITMPTVDKVIKGLKIMAYRAALAVERLEISHHHNRIDILAKKLQALKTEEAEAKNRIDLSTINIDEVEKQLQTHTTELETNLQQLIEAESNSVGATTQIPLDTDTGRLLLMRVTQARVGETQTRIQMLADQAKILLATKTHDSEELRQALVTWQAVVTLTKQKSKEWQIAAERELRQAAVARAALVNDTPESGHELSKIQLLRQQEAQSTLEALEQLNNQLLAAQVVLDQMQYQIQQHSMWYERAWVNVKIFFQQIWPTIHKWLNFSFFKIGDIPFTPWAIIKVALTFLIAAAISKAVMFVCTRVSHSKYGRLHPRAYTTARLSHYFILFIATLVALTVLGIDFSKLVIILGALSVGIGFGLKDVVLNFVSGVMILFEQNVKVGDYVEMQTGEMGRVSAIHVQNSLIRTFDGIDMIIPNNLLLSAPIINWTMQDPYRRLHIQFGVAYGTDKELVREAVLEAADTLDSTIKGHLSFPDPQVRLVNFGESSLEFELLVWVSLRDFKNYNGQIAAYRWAIETALRKHDIQIPFPQRDIHIVSKPQKNT